MTSLRFNEFDYTTLLDALKTYRYPRNRISSLLKKGEIIRIKKGIYLLGPDQRKTPYVPEILANMIYGPSYISLEYALSRYGLIPEGVHTVTSVTSERNREFKTPAGRFTYAYLRHEYYPHGVTWTSLPDGRGYLIATPEKALIDRIYMEKGISARSAMKELLFDNLRLDQNELQRLDHVRMGQLLNRYTETHMKILATVMGELHE